jgi:hypothetical protein
MAAELDHLFVCVSPGAPEAERLIELGLVEGTRNSHPGQGTANRRFFFANAMLELLWVADAAEAQSEMARPTRLWERWSKRETGASPFGVIQRPTGEDRTPPFAGFRYSPPYFGGLSLIIAQTGIEEPMRAYFDAAHPRDYGQRFVEHPAGWREITAYTVASRPEHLLEIEFDHARRGQVLDLRPQLPLRLLV